MLKKHRFYIRLVCGYLVSVGLIFGGNAYALYKTPRPSFMFEGLEEFLTGLFIASLGFILAVVVTIVLIIRKVAENPENKARRCIFYIYIAIVTLLMSASGLLYFTALHEASFGLFLLGLVVLSVGLPSLIAGRIKVFKWRLLFYFLGYALSAGIIIPLMILPYPYESAALQNIYAITALVAMIFAAGITIAVFVNAIKFLISLTGKK